MVKKMEYKIAEKLRKAKDTFSRIDLQKNSDTISHLWLCQVIAYDLGLKKYQGLKFSKLCGYNFNITL